MSAVPALLRPILLLALLALLSVGSMKYRTKVNAAQNAAVPPPPTQRADRFGIYNWNVNDSAFPTDGSTDLLNWGAAKVAQMGSRTIRVAISSRDDYGVNPPEGPGGGLAGSPNLVE